MIKQPQNNIREKKCWRKIIIKSINKWKILLSNKRQHTHNHKTHQIRVIKFLMQYYTTIKMKQKHFFIAFPFCPIEKSTTRQTKFIICLEIIEEFSTHSIEYFFFWNLKFKRHLRNGQFQWKSFFFKQFFKKNPFPIFNLYSN